MSAALIGKAALSFLLSAVKPLMESQKADSLVNISQPARVEPITMIDQRVLPLPYTGDLLHSLVSLFAGYYLQAAALQMNIGSVNTIRLLDQLNPNRTSQSLLKISGPGLESSHTVADSYLFALPRRRAAFGLESYGLNPNENRSALEAFKDNLSEGSYSASAKAGPATVDATGDGVDLTLNPNQQNVGKVEFGRNAIQDIHQSAPLSVGKMLEVKVTDGDKVLNIPISVRLQSVPVDSSVLAHILSDGTKNITWKERWNAFRAGELEFWRDLVLASDLVDEHRKVLMKDKTGAYREILARRRGNATKALSSGTPSLATASNLMVLSSATAKEVERKVLGKLSDVATRDKIFKMSYLMILAIIDADNEMVTFYHRGINLPTVVSVKELKVANKGNGSDVGDILQKLLLGKPAVL